jgi:UPF0271 protein
MHIDLNADMGESFGMYVLGDDEEFMKYITSANIACGFHASDPSVMKKTVDFAVTNNVKIGAHPGLPDLQGFGRREMKMSPQEIYDMLIYQVGALNGFCQAAGVSLHHVKPHGSLYGMAHKNTEVAQAICQAVRDLDQKLFLYIMKAGVIAGIAQEMNINTVYEIFSDLNYDPAGNLVITRSHDAHDPEAVSQRVLRMIRENKVLSTDGSEISIEGNSVCVHGDTPKAIDIVKHLRSTLTAEQYDIQAP